jgi:serine/threonine protein kinase
MEKSLLMSASSSSDDNDSTLCETISDDSLLTPHDSAEDLHALTDSNIFTLDPDFLLPRGLLHLTSQKVLMGCHGVMKTGLFRNKYKIALKTYDANLSVETKRSLEHEMSVLSRISNYPTVLACYGWTIHEDNHRTQIIYELSTYGSLDRLLREEEIDVIPLTAVICWLNDLADGLSFLHSKGIVMNNISTENILVFEKLNIKIANFSSATIINTNSSINTYNTSNSTNTNNSNHSISTSVEYKKDINDFLQTSLQILTRSSLIDLQKQHLTQKEFRNISQYREKQIIDGIHQFSIMEANYATRLGWILLNVSQEKFTTAADIHYHLLSLLEDAYDGDPRERGYINTNGNQGQSEIKRTELLLMACTEDILQLIQLSPRISVQSQLLLKKTLYMIKKARYVDKAQQIGCNVENMEGNTIIGSTMYDMSSFDDNLHFLDHDLSSDIYQAATLKTEAIIDSRKSLIEWLRKDCKVSYAISEELVVLFLNHGIISVKILKEKLLFDPFCLIKLPFKDDAKNMILNRIKEKALMSGNNKLKRDSSPLPSTPPSPSPSPHHRSAFSSLTITSPTNQKKLQQYQQQHQQQGRPLSGKHNRLVIEQEV